MNLSNAAALLLGKGQPLQVQPVDYISPEKNELIVKNHAVAINPVDGSMQKLGNELFPWMKFPQISGSDVAGEVVEVGPGVTRFKPGDRVCGLAIGVPPPSGGKLSGAFQTFTLLKEVLTSHIPESLAFENAVVTPLALSTAACGLYQKDYLALVPPSLYPKPTGKCIVIWAGSSSVGSNAIQLAVASGYEVITTASPKNFEYTRKLGASHVFDYKSESVTKDIIALLKGKTIAGAVSIGQGSVKACYEILAHSEGNKFVASAAPLTEELPSGLQSKFIFGSNLKDNEVGPMIWREFFPAALERGKWSNVPGPEIVGQGLTSIQNAIDILSNGVSARKVVVKL
ncbi:hypothetical protein N7462_008894 [Penicillium macrosclerotiorum]|uniref:uncharacterized protein n=1 Tax=Penicillium macrosclerotiorum TaxID=303699 RepID=UPI0025487443|nr:uncharacterized protein N7462_008894 [Penicillium macrosclerotiorum]KAJ5675997.1 hypothetical protein N7462_008894 [Penicillium macrosclerotiorum]